MDGDVVEDVVVWGGAPHRLHGAVEAEQLGDQAIIDGVDGVDRPDTVKPRRQEANHCCAQQVCGGFMSGDGNDHRGDDDVVEFEIGIGVDEAEEIVAGMAAAVGSQREKFGQDSVTNPPDVRLRGLPAVQRRDIQLESHWGTAG